MGAPRRPSVWGRWLATLGPGLIVMLADNDAGSVITAAQSGHEWGYRLLLLQVLLVPLLFVVQELAVRLGLANGKGFSELILERFGRGWAWLFVAALVSSCLGALVTQFSGLVGIGQLYGLPAWFSVAWLVVLVLAMVLTGSYHGVERVALLFGLFGLAFLMVAWRAHPVGGQVWRQMGDMPMGNGRYLYLLAANLGTSVMPWTVFYQQSALINKGLSLRDLPAARWDTLFGALVCQLLAAAVLVAAAATAGASQGSAFDSVGDIAQAFTHTLGASWGQEVFALGLGGAAMVATVVICLSLAWAVGEASGRRHALADHPRQAPRLQLPLVLLLLVAGGLVVSGMNLVDLSITTGVVNALLLPVLLGFLYRLARTELPPALRLRGAYGALVGCMFVIAATVGVVAGVLGLVT
ncbi:NRAMP family divalent metal transporter [Ideonella sp. B508-1]|uniref:NRAMP family divalent metal transporter n=1 Tax=Ideonella sp. B508-1 TaxID=137716 RepID=UPI001F45E034|nr:divalent metal cation transporter [Ideonella sp. B508-1]